MAKSPKRQKTNVKSPKERVWIYVAVISMTVYVVWRIFFTIPEHAVYGWLATLCGIVLVFSESISMLEGTEHFFRLRKKTMPEKPEVPYEWYPHVDVLIATHNEETALIYKTVNGCRHMEYPDKTKVHIYVCDDGNRPEMAKLARDMGVGYCTMEENKDAKAGNLNNALQMTCSPWIVTFDADMIPTRKFLMETVPYIFLPRMKKLNSGAWVERTEEEMDDDYKIGFIQTPQSFYNPDLFQFNFYSEQRIPNEQDFFFREINIGRNGANAPLYAGSNTLIARKALEDVGGIATGTITEDFETGIRIQAEGYTCYALDTPLAHGLAPVDISGLIKQRVRWGRGCVSSLRRVHIILNPKLKLNAKLSYLSCLLYWWTFFRRFVYIAAPILFVLFGIPVVICDLWELLLIWLPSYLLYNHALKVTSGKIRTQRWSNIVDTTIFPYMILPILLETIFIRQKKFNVTNKVRSAGRKSDAQLAIPHIVLLALDLLALVVSVRAAILTGNFGSIIIIFWLTVNALNLIMAVFFMCGRKNLRTSDRFSVRLPVEASYQGKKYYGETLDLSETGMSFLTENPVYTPHRDDFIELRLKTDQYEARVEGRAVQVTKTEQGWRYGIRLENLQGEDRDNYFQILYDRHHSLADQMGKSVSVFEDVFLNIHRRTSHSRESRRALPRVELDRELRTAEGGTVRAVNFNYEYILLDTAGPQLPRTLDLILPDGGEVMHCRAEASKSGLYAVENYRELLFDGAFDKLLGVVKEAGEPIPSLRS